MVVAPKNRIRFIAFDTETTGLSVYKGHRPFLFIYFDGNKTITTKNPEHVRELLEDPTVGKIMHNAIFDMGMMRSQGIEVRGQIFDTMIMAHLFDENLPKKSLDYCAAKFLNEKKLGATVECWLIENKYTKKLRAETGRSYYELVPDEIMLPYASRDAELTYKLFMFFSKRLIAMQLWDLVISECNLIAALLDMEWRGVAIDVPYYRMLEAQLLQKKHSLEQRIFQVAGKEFDINSTLQLGQLLEENGVKVPRTDKKRSKNSTEYNYNVDEAFLATINHPLASEVLEYRGVCKNLSTYVQNLLEHQVDGVVHCHLWQIGARTGRFSSFAPNLQTVPKDDDAAIDRQEVFPRFVDHRSALEALFKDIDAGRLEFIKDITSEKIKHVCGDSELLSIILSAWQQGEDTKMIRRGFIARPGFINFYVDYKAMEFRIFADYIEDSELLKRLKNGEDVHQATADMVGISRKQAKTLNFALIYGMGAAALALKLGVTLEQAAEFIRRYFERMPSAKLVIQNIKAVCRKRGYVRNPFMRRRRLASDEVYKAPNALIQGCCADIVKQAMLKIHHRLKAAGAKSGMILMVHDEIVFEIAQDELHLMPELVFIMESWGHMFKVPIDVDVEATTTNWCACQGYELQRITECAATALTAEQLFWKEELEAMHDATLLELESEADAQPGMREFTLGLEWQDVVLGDWYIEHVATVRAESLRQAKQKWADKTGHSIAEAWDRRAQTFKGWKVVEVKHGEGYGCAVNASRESNTN